MLGKMKPIPRFILIAALIGGAVFGVQRSGILDKVKESTQTRTEQVEKTELVITPGPGPLVQLAPVAQPKVVEPSPQVEQTSNAGLDAVLKQGSKK
jgi:hypothetical protein